MGKLKRIIGLNRKTAGPGMMAGPYMLRNTGIQKRLLVSFILISMVPVLLVGLFSFCQSAKSIDTKIRNYSTRLVEQMGMNIAKEAGKYKYFCDKVTVSNTVQFNLSNYYVFDDIKKGEYFSQIEKLIQEMFSEYIYLSNIRINTMNGDVLYELGYELFRQEDMLKLNRNAAAMKGGDYWTHMKSLDGNDCIVLCRQINSEADSTRPIGFISAFVDEDVFVRNSYEVGDIGENAKVFMLDSQGWVASSGSPDIRPGQRYENTGVIRGISENKSGSTGMFTLRSGEGNSLVIYKHIKPMSWYLVGIIPFSYIRQTADEIRNSLLIVCAICIAASVFLSLVISLSITVPFKQIVRFVKDITNGNLDVRLKDESHDEMGYLAGRLNIMVSRISGLLEQVAQEQKMKREKEIQVLQAQINPHFLFNTLNSLKFTAMMSRVPVVSDGIGALAELLKNTILDDKYMISIGEELENIDNYIFIQKIRYGDSFKVEYDIGVDVRSYLILKFLLQPIVENSIIHGLEGLNRDMTIRITIREEEDILAIHVTDNGKGFDMKSSAAEVEKTVKSRRIASIGISNVNERIKLNFGSAYGLTIESKPNEGTRVCIRMPVKRKDEES